MKQRDHFGDQGIDYRMLLKWILNEKGVRVWTSGSGEEPVAPVNTIMNLQIP
jgi:hypothetical protein